MDEFESLSHTKWECKYHVVFIPKYRRKVLYEQLRKELGAVFRELAARKQSRVEEGHLMPDHVHVTGNQLALCPFARSSRRIRCVIHDTWRRTDGNATKRR